MKMEAAKTEELDAENNLLDDLKGERQDRKSFQVDSSLTSCGVGLCKPGFVQRCADIKAFTANVCLINFLYIASFAYLVGVLRTIEKRFGLSSVKSGSLMSAVDITTTCLTIFVGYVGDRAHKPRILSVMMSMIGVALIFCYSGAYFYLGPSEDAEIAAGISRTNTSEMQLCSGETALDLCDNNAKKGEGNNSAYMLLLFGGILIGIGGAPCVSMVFSYIDENLHKADSALYIGMKLKLSIGDIRLAKCDTCFSLFAVCFSAGYGSFPFWSCSWFRTGWCCADSSRKLSW